MTVLELTGLARLTVAGPRIVIDGPEQSCTAVAVLPGASWARGRRLWTLPATPGVAHRAVAELKAAGWKVTGDQRAHELTQAWQRTLAAAPYRTRTDLPDVPSGSPHDAWMHQRQAFYFARELTSPLLQMGMGTGKSRVAVDLADDWQAMTVLVLCPRRVVGVWPREVAKHSARRDEWIIAARVPRKRGDGYLASPSGQQRLELFDDAISRGRLLGRPVMLVVNYEAAWREPLATFLLELHPDLVILDEIHRVKAAGGQASRYCARLRDRAKRRLGLSGTLMPHTALDVYGPCRFAEPALFGLNAAAFRAEYGEPKTLANGLPVTDGQGRPVMGGVRPEKRPQLAERLAWITVEADSDEVLDLPDLLTDERAVELGPDTAKAYEQLEVELAADIAGGVVTADNALTKLLRLTQATSGFLPVEQRCARCLGNGVCGFCRGEPVGNAASWLDGQPRPPAACPRCGNTNTSSDAAPRCPACKGRGVTERVVELGTEKADALGEVLDDLPGRRTALDGRELGPEPVVIFARFRHDLDAIQAVATDRGLRYGELSGRADTVLDEHAVMRDDIDVAAVQWQAGGVGVDLTRARYAISYSVGFELELWLQGIARLRRPSEHVDARRDEHGTHRPLYLIQLVVPGTADEATYQALADREDAVGKVLDRLRARIANGGRS